MVERDSGRLFGLVSLLLLMSLYSVLANAVEPEKTLSVTISKTDKQWGQPLYVTLRYRGAESLEKINLESWRELAVITDYDDYRDEDEQGRGVQVKKLRVFPRKTGAGFLPALRLGAANSEPVSYDVRNAVVKSSAIELEYNVSTLSPWQRQAVFIRVFVQTADASARLQLDDFKQESMISYTLDPIRQKQADGRYGFESGWVIHPVKSGFSWLDLPAVKYRLSGSNRRKFYLPLVYLDVKALPAYLPPTLPVGGLVTDSQITSIAGARTPNNWEIAIETDGLVRQGIPGLGAQLAELTGYDLDKVDIQSSRLPTGRYLTQYHAPLPKWLLPVGKNPVITLRYFDPDSGRLEQMTHSLPRQLQAPVWAWWAAVVTAIFIILLFIWICFPWMKSLFFRLKLHRQLKSAKSARVLRKIILDNGQYVTLSEWDNSSNNKTSVIAELNRHCFSLNKNRDITDLKRKLLRVT